MNKVLVCGGRDYWDYPEVCRVLDRFHHEWGVAVVIHGSARGADSLAERWAKEREVPYYGVPARWKAYRRRAGPLRNQWMLDNAKPDWIIAFPGGKGTADMIERAEKAGVRRYEHSPS